MRTLVQELSPETQQKLDMFLTRDAQEIYFGAARLRRAYSLELLYKHSIASGVAIITSEVLGAMMESDTTMPASARCAECRRQITTAWRWVALNNENGAIEKLPDGVTTKERGQAAVVLNNKHRFVVQIFCPTCRETVILPKGAEWQSFVQAIKKQRAMVARRQARAAMRRAEAEAAAKAIADELSAIPSPSPVTAAEQPPEVTATAEMVEATEPAPEAAEETESMAVTWLDDAPTTPPKKQRRTRKPRIEVEEE